MNKKHLIILAGSPRGGEKTWNSMYKYCLDYLDADLAICCGDDINKSISLYKRAKYKWLFSELDNWIKYYTSNSYYNAIDYLEKGKNTGLYNSGVVHFAIKDIILKRYLHIIKKYDYIIYTRFDQYYIDYHPFGATNKILIPEGEDYFGVCDRHAMFHSDYAEKILGICKYINTEDAQKETGDFLNCEKSYLNHLKYLGLDEKISRIKRFQFTTSNKGDQTRGRVAIYNLWFCRGIKLKYPSEFVKSFNNRREKYSFIYNFSNHPILYANYLFLRLRKAISPFFPNKIKKIITFLLNEK